MTEIDLNAYVDGQLDPARRIEVEDFLSRHPEEAMRVMADLRQRDALRWALGASQQAPAESGRAAGTDGGVVGVKIAELAEAV
ncbi:anti-sigma factor family protein, partial [Bordetella bronchiseptica]|uniref:anti-sigma factor family protein n=1 Tax=Bordetella bronchiseptica TaxID=518 RepID=UPI003EDC1160